MRYCEIASRPAAPDSHPYTTDISIAPAEFSTFERLMQDRPGVRLLARVDRPDVWIVHVACASAAVRDRLHDAWGWPVSSAHGGARTCFSRQVLADGF
jgi:hypothetical protein